MSRLDSFQFNQLDVTFERIDAVAIVRLARSVNAGLTNLDSRTEYFGFLDKLDDDGSIGALVTINDDGAFDEASYGKLLTTIVGEEVALSNLDSLPDFKGNPAQSRQLYFLHYLLKRRLNANKLIIDGLQGEVTAPFFGECLSADFRFATPETSFSLCHVKYGLHPTTALAFFLPRFVGQGRSVDLLLRGGVISAEEALELGLINEIFPKESFRQQCIDVATELCKSRSNAIRARSMLYAPLERDLDAAFDIETRFYLAGRW